MSFRCQFISIHDSTTFHARMRACAISKHDPTTYHCCQTTGHINICTPLDTQTPLWIDIATTWHLNFLAIPQIGTVVGPFVVCNNFWTPPGIILQWPPRLDLRQHKFQVKIAVSFYSCCQWGPQIHIIRELKLASQKSCLHWLWTMIATEG